MRPPVVLVSISPVTKLLHRYIRVGGRALRTDAAVIQPGYDDWAPIIEQWRCQPRAPELLNEQPEPPRTVA